MRQSIWTSNIMPDAINIYDITAILMQAANQQTKRRPQRRANDPRAHKHQAVGDQRKPLHVQQRIQTYLRRPATIRPAADPAPEDTRATKRGRGGTAEDGGRSLAPAENVYPPAHHQQQQPEPS